VQPHTQGGRLCWHCVVDNGISVRIARKHLKAILRFAGQKTHFDVVEVSLADELFTR